MSLEQIQAQLARQLSSEDIVAYVDTLETHGFLDQINPWITTLLVSSTYKPEQMFSLPAVIKITGDVLLTTINEAVVKLGQQGIQAKLDFTQAIDQDEFGVPLRCEAMINMHVERVRPIRKLL